MVELLHAHVNMNTDSRALVWPRLSHIVTCFPRLLQHSPSQKAPGSTLQHPNSRSQGTTCLLRKYVFDAHEEVRCSNYHCGPFSERRPYTIGRAGWIGHRLCRIPRRNHLMESWLFHFLASLKGVNKCFCHGYGSTNLLIALVTYREPTPSNYFCMMFSP